MAITFDRKVSGTTYLLLFVVLTFAVLGGMWVMSPMFSGESGLWKHFQALRGTPVVIHVGMGALIFVVGASLFLIWATHAVSSQPAIEISTEGLAMHVGPVSTRTIPWSAVDAVYYDRLAGVERLMIIVADLDAYRVSPSIAHRIVAWVAHFGTEDTVAVSAFMVQAELDEIEEAIRTHRGH